MLLRRSGTRFHTLFVFLLVLRISLCFHMSSFIDFSDSEQNLAQLSSVLDQIYSSFSANRLSVNPSKTEYLLIGTPQQRRKITNSSVYFQNLAFRGRP